MKFFLLVAVLPMISAVTLIPSEGLINGITDLQNRIAADQADAIREVFSLRQAASTIAFNYKNGYVDIIKAAITSADQQDAPTRATLAAKTPSACIDNLNSFLDNIKELAGFAISNCVEDKSGWNSEIADIASSVSAIEGELLNLIQAIYDGLIGRNSYTEPDSILARQLELYQQRLDQLRALLDALSSAVESKTTEIEGYGYTNEQACFDAITANIASAIDAVTNQLPVCDMFSGRGQRFNINLNPDKFFPGVAARNQNKN